MLTMRSFIVVAALLASPSSALAQSAVWRVPQVGRAATPAVAAGGSNPGANAPGSTASVSATVPAQSMMATNNLDPRACMVDGVTVGGTVAGPGQVARVNMTTAGGKPANGAPVYPAASSEDAADNVPFNPASARGKFTTVKPDLTMPAYPGRRQNLCSAAPVVVSNASYDTDKTVTITVPTPQSTSVQFVDNSGANTATPDTTQTFRGTKLPVSAITGSSIASFTADGTDAERKLANNETLVWTFVVDDIVNLAVDTDGTGVRSWNGSGDGWRLDVFGRASSVRLTTHVSGTTLVAAGPLGLAPGRNIVVVSRHDGAFHLTNNGGVTVSIADTGADTVGGQTFTIDYAYGVMAGVVKLHRAMTDAEMEDVSLRRTGTADQIYSRWFIEGTDPYAPNPTLTSDVTAQWYVDFSAYTGGTLSATAGAAGTGFSFTTTGTPIVRTWVMTWYHAVAPMFQDGMGFLDSRHSTQTTPFARIRFRVLHQWEAASLVFGLISEDTDNNDEADVTMFWTSRTGKNLPTGSAFVGTFVGDAGAVVSFKNVVQAAIGGDANLLWYPTGAGPIDVDIVASDLVSWYDVFASGDYINRLGLVTSVTETGAGTRVTSVVESGDYPIVNRLIVVSDGISMGGHSRDLIGESPASGAPCTRIRTVYPGKVTCWVMPSLSLARLAEWGGSVAPGNMAPLAAHLVDLSKQGGPARREILLNVGMWDWDSIGEGASTVGTYLAALVDLIHDFDPGIKIDYAVPFQTLAYASTNTQGQALQSYVDAEAAVVTGRSWLHKVDLSGPTAITYSGDAGFLHPDSAGQQAVANNVRARLGY